jgi:hypothetical protein
VDADTEMEGFLSGGLDEVLVGANTGGLESLGGQLLVLVGDQVDAEREVVYVGLLATEVEDADLGIGDTTVEPALGVLRSSQSIVPSSCCSSATYGLVLAVTVATGGTAGHCDGCSCFEINEREFGGRGEQRRARKLMRLSVKRLRERERWF